MDSLNLQVFGKLPENYWAGNYRKAFLGACTDPEIQASAASGGIVSGLLAYALEEKLIDGVYLLTPSWGKPFKLETILATSIDEIKASAGSYYWPAPVGHRLRDILRSEGKFAFIGLPCEIQALRKAQKVLPRLNEKIAFSIGLFCGSRTTIQGQLFGLKRYGVNPARIAKIEYRHSDWPGHLKISMIDGSAVHVPKSKQLQGYASQLFCHQRCVFCHDSLADLADISTGDAIRLEDFRQPHEKSIFVARTNRGVDLLENAQKAGQLNLREVEVSKLIHSQIRPLMHKKQALWSRIKVAKFMKREVPTIQLTRPDVKENNFLALISGAKVVLLSVLTSKTTFRKIMALIPMKILVKHSFFDRYS
jgi:coenzyme F420 hydrogenase subunit beta